MLDALRVVNALCWKLSLSSYTLSLNGVWFFLTFLVLPFLFFLTVVLLFLDLCPHSTSPMYSVWQFSIFNNILTLFIKKKVTISCSQATELVEHRMEPKEGLDHKGGYNESKRSIRRWFLFLSFPLNLKQKSISPSA